MKILKLDSYVLRQTAITGCLNIAELITGFGISWTAPIIPKLLDVNQTPLPYVITESQASLVASILYTTVIGAFLAGYVTNLIGRRACFIVAGVMNLISYILLTVANNLVMIYVARALIGIFLSFSILNNIIYLGEVATSHIRGKILTSTGVFHAMGRLLVYCIGPYLSYRGVGYVIIGINIIYIASLFFVPESPVYYIIKGNEEAAKRSLRYLGRTKDIEGEIKAMTAKLNKEGDTKHVWSELFTVKNNRKSLFVTLPLLFFQESCGIVAVFFFATPIFIKAGSSVDPNVASIIIGATSFVGTIISPMFVEKGGRKVLLIISTSGCALTMTILGVYFYLDKYNNEAVVSLKWLPLLLLIVAIISFTCGLNIIPNTITGEMFDPKVRALGSSLSLCFGFLIGFITTTVFGYVLANLGAHVGFWIFAVINLAALLFVISLVPETKGKTLLEIRQMMATY